MLHRRRRWSRRYFLSFALATHKALHGLRNGNTGRFHRIAPKGATLVGALCHVRPRSRDCLYYRDFPLILLLNRDLALDQLSIFPAL
jgi:hypothetical protein